MRAPLTSWLLRILVAALIGVVVAIVTATTLPFARTAAGLAGASLAAVIVFSVTALVCAAVARRGRLPSLMLTGIVASFVAAIGWSVLVVGAHSQSIAVHHWLSSLWPVSIWAIFCAITAGLYARRASSSGVAVVRGATLVSVASLAALLVFAVWYSDFVGDRYALFLRIAGALAIVTVCALAMSGILIAMPRLLGRRPAAVEEARRLDYTVTCPRCASTQPFRTGGALCSVCGLRISVVVP